MADADRQQFRCPNCGSGQGDQVWSSKGISGFVLKRCRRCQLVGTSPTLSEESILGYYPATYYGQSNIRFNALFERLVTWFRRRRARRICRYKRTGRVLDIGCGRGHILAHMRDRGWEVHGVELSDWAVQHARDCLGLDVVIGRFDPNRFEPESFDVVILWHALEHMHDVSAALAGAATLLRPGGLVVVAVPNFASWQARLSHYHWFHLDLPRHYSHFEDDWLCRRLQTLGFTIREVNHFSFEQNPYGWIQSCLNAAGLHHNLLYDVLKSRSARMLVSPLRHYPLQGLLSVLGMCILLAPACAMLLPETIFRRGATIEIYATREAPSRETNPGFGEV